MYSISPQPQPNHIPSAPPIDEFYISYPQPIQQQYVYTQQPIQPQPHYTSFRTSDIQTTEQYRRNEIERRNQQDKDCCFTICTILCCCFVATEL